MLQSCHYRGNNRWEHFVNLCNPEKKFGAQHIRLIRNTIYEKSIPEKQSLSEVKLGKGSPDPEKSGQGWKPVPNVCDP